MEILDDVLERVVKQSYLSTPTNISDIDLLCSSHFYNESDTMTESEAVIQPACVQPLRVTFARGEGVTTVEAGAAPPTGHTRGYVC